MATQPNGNWAKNPVRAGLQACVRLYRYGQTSHKQQKDQVLFLSHIFKHFSVLGCGKCMPLSLTQIHTQRPAQTLPTVQPLNTPAHDFVFTVCVCVNIKVFIVK